MLCLIPESQSKPTKCTDSNAHVLIGVDSLVWFTDIREKKKKGYKGIKTNRKAEFCSFCRKDLVASSI